MNFTKDYIELCKDKRIQELRPDKIEVGDWYIWKNNLPTVNDCPEVSRIDFKKYPNIFIYLPTGDQLDEEIIKIVDIENVWVYKFVYHNIGAKRYYAELIDKSTYDIETDSLYVVYSKHDDNPLIAKLKLLLQLMQ